MHGFGGKYVFITRYAETTASSADKEFNFTNAKKAAPSREIACYVIYYFYNCESDCYVGATIIFDLVTLPTSLVGKKA